MFANDEAVDRIVAGAEFALQSEPFLRYLSEAEVRRIRGLVADMLRAVSEDILLDAVLTDKFDEKLGGVIDVAWRHRSKTMARWTELRVAGRPPIYPR